MAEYIKREDILKILHAARYNCAYNREDLMSNGTLDVYKWLKTQIEKLPAADVVPRELYQKALSDVVTLSVERKKGKWKTAYLDHEAFGIRPQVWYCSECHQITSFRTFFCSNCGADLRGEP